MAYGWNEVYHITRLNITEMIFTCLIITLDTKKTMKQCNTQRNNYNIYKVCTKN